MTVEEITKFITDCDNKGVLDTIKYACQNKLTELMNNDNSEDKLSFLYAASRQRGGDRL